MWRFIPVQLGLINVGALLEKERPALTRHYLDTNKIVLVVGTADVFWFHGRLFLGYITLQVVLLDVKAPFRRSITATLINKAIFSLFV